LIGRRGRGTDKPRWNRGEFAAFFEFHRLDRQGLLRAGEKISMTGGTAGGGGDKKKARDIEWPSTVFVQWCMVTFIRF